MRLLAFSVTMGLIEISIVLLFSLVRLKFVNEIKAALGKDNSV